MSPFSPPPPSFADAELAGEAQGSSATFSGQRQSRTGIWIWVCLWPQATDVAAGFCLSCLSSRLLCHKSKQRSPSENTEFSPGAGGTRAGQGVSQAGAKSRRGMGFLPLLLRELLSPSASSLNQCVPPSDLRESHLNFFLGGHFYLQLSTG